MTPRVDPLHRSPSRLTLSHLRIRRPVETALDVGTGCRIQAILVGRISVATTSSFYRTSGGVGPGTSKARGFHRDFCSLGLWDGTAGTPPDGIVTVFELAGDRIADVTITELGYDDLGEGAPPDQELPAPRPSAVELRVQIDPDGGGFAFLGWAGACSGTGQCGFSGQYVPPPPPPTTTTRPRTTGGTE